MGKLSGAECECKPDTAVRRTLRGDHAPHAAGVIGCYTPLDAYLEAQVAECLLGDAALPSAHATRSVVRVACNVRQWCNISGVTSVV